MMTIVEVSLNAIFSLVQTLIKIILAPIDLIIINYMPNVDNLLGYVNQFFDYIQPYVGWCVDAISLIVPRNIIAIIISYYVFKFTLQFSIWSIKLVLKWVKSFK